VPYQSLVDLYHAELPSMRPVLKITPHRQRLIREAWHGDLGANLDNWRDFFAYIRTDCPFLTGAKPGKDGKPLLIGLEWLLHEEHFPCIRRGDYEEEVKHG
jgi:hypothetical protein